MTERKAKTDGKDGNWLVLYGNRVCDEIYLPRRGFPGGFVEARDEWCSPFHKDVSPANVA
jgi:hypothetical protein